MANVLVVGFGIEGRALADYFLKKGDEVTIADIKPIKELPEELVQKYLELGVEFINGEDYLDTLTDYNLIAFSPGMKPKAYHQIVDSGVETTTQMQLFFANSPTKNLIGVTGTKGKGTTSTLIYEILKAAGKTAYLVGNIGEPALPLLDDLQPEDWVVLELSSYQLRDLNISPHIGVILNITPDHMDVHPDFADYVSSKANLIRFQSTQDYALLNSEYEVTRDLASQTQAQVEFFNKTDFEKTGFKLKLPGRHNYENAAAALRIADLLEIDRNVVEQVMTNFQGLPHRLQEVGQINGVRYIDDSFATSPSPTMVGINAFTEPKIVILGGSGKIEDFRELVDAVIQNSTIKHVLTIGQSGPTIESALNTAGYDQTSGGFNDIEEVVNKAHELAEPGDIVLLSPADASFGWFKNYADRGEKFSAAVAKLN